LATIKKEMIKKGLLDKHGKPNESTPTDYLAGSVAQLSMVTPIKKEVEDFVVPSAGPESAKRKVELSDSEEKPKKKKKNKSVSEEPAAQEASMDAEDEEPSGEKKKKKKKKSKSQDDDE